MGVNARFAGCEFFKEPPFLIRPEPNQGTGCRVQGADDAPGQRKSPLWAGFSHTSSIVLRLAGGRWGGKENREVGRYEGHGERPVAGSLWPVTKGDGGVLRNVTGFGPDAPREAPTTACGGKEGATRR